MECTTLISESLSSPAPVGKVYERALDHWAEPVLFGRSEQFYKNEAQIWPKVKNNIRTIQAGIWNHKCKIYFFELFLTVAASYDYF